MYFSKNLPVLGNISQNLDVKYVFSIYQVRSQWECEFHRVSARFGTQREISAIFEDAICHEQIARTLKRNPRHHFCRSPSLHILRYIANHHQENMTVQCIPPYTPLLYSKTGVCRGISIFLIFAPKHILWVLVRTASARRF